MRFYQPPKYTVAASEEIEPGTWVWIHDDGRAHPKAQGLQRWNGLLAVRSYEDPTGWQVVAADMLFHQRHGYAMTPVDPIAAP